ncbi:pilus assembly protein TadG-related protein [Noviherbaspirillum sp. ST9]|uniref:pilus assembly protein TadG-related protein n=1 Tax=Noviherbaspirillum sp. ST9 TaxID=3401606 RepID=UPI003B589F3F
MNRRHLHKSRGAIAITFALSLFALLGFLSMTVDLGRTYTMRTELQNTADAAALAGALELNQTLAGVLAASARALAVAEANAVNYSAGITITQANLAVGTCPEDGCMVPISSITSDTLAAGRTFLRVQIPSGNMPTFFGRFVPTAGGAGFANTNTFGSAVAGRFLAQITPLGVCAVDTIRGGRRTIPGLPDELVEFGFRRGVSYNLPQLNPLSGASGDPIWINPVTAPPAACNPSSSSATSLHPFVCSGTSTVAAAVPGFVYANTGGSYGPMEKALNSRFDDFLGGNACDPGSAPPDINVKEFRAPPPTPGSIGHPREWMEPDPVQQTISLNPTTFKPLTSPTQSQYGALWSFSRAVQATGTSPNATAGAPFDASVAHWNALYAMNAPAGTYPTSVPTPPFPSNPETHPAPYRSTAGNFFQPPNPSRPGVMNRRVLNVAIIDCSSLVPGPGLSCAALPVLGVGRFFMQRKADLTGGTKRIDAEFAGLLTELPPQEIRLYR